MQIKEIGCHGVDCVAPVKVIKNFLQLLLIWHYLGVEFITDANYLFILFFLLGTVFYLSLLQ
jgi:hypothetical protein